MGFMALEGLYFITAVSFAGRMVFLLFNQRHDIEVKRAKKRTCCFAGL